MYGIGVYVALQYGTSSGAFIYKLKGFPSPLSGLWRSGAACWRDNLFIQRDDSIIMLFCGKQGAAEAQGMEVSQGEIRFTREQTHR